jgi:hypothetical protein
MFSPLLVTLLKVTFVGYRLGPSGQGIHYKLRVSQRFRIARSMSKTTHLRYSSAKTLCIEVNDATLETYGVGRHELSLEMIRS